MEMNINYKFRKSDSYCIPESERSLSISAILYDFLKNLYAYIFMYVFIDQGQINNVHRYICIYVFCV